MYSASTDLVFLTASIQEENVFLPAVVNGDSRVQHKGSTVACIPHNDISFLPGTCSLGDSKASMAAFPDTCTSLDS